MSLQPVNFCSLCLKNVFFYPTNSWKPADIHCGGQKTEKQHSLTSEELQPEEHLTFLLDKREKLIFKPTHDPTAQIHQTLLIQARGLNASAGWWLTAFHKLRINSSWRFRSHCKSVSSSLAARRTTTTWIQSRDVCSGQSALIINWLIILTNAQNVVKYNCLSALACLTFLPSSQWVFSSEQRRDLKAASPVYVVSDE